jgi:hypothetical protein
VAALAVVVVAMLEGVLEVITIAQDRPPHKKALRIVIALDSLPVLVWAPKLERALLEPTVLLVIARHFVMHIRQLLEVQLLIITIQGCLLNKKLHIAISLDIHPATV